MCWTMSNMRQCYMFHKHMFSDGEIITLVSTQHMSESPLSEKALETRGGNSCQFCEIQLKPLKSRVLQRVTKTQQMTKWDKEQGNNCCEIKDIFAWCTDDNASGGNAKIWNLEESQKLRWDRCWLTKSLPHCLSREPGHCTQHGMNF